MVQLIYAVYIRLGGRCQHRTQAPPIAARLGLQARREPLVHKRPKAKRPAGGPFRITRSVQKDGSRSERGSRGTRSSTARSPLATTSRARR